jgi:hypothetical protein
MGIFFLEYHTFKYNALHCKTMYANFISLIFKQSYKETGQILFGPHYIDTETQFQKA